MTPLTARQREVLNFIDTRQRDTGVGPSLREIAAHFGFSSMNAAATHVRALKKKGAVRQGSARLARSLQVVRPGHAPADGMARIPVYGSIPAGFSDKRHQETAESLTLDISLLPVSDPSRLYALEVRGESMIGKHILPGDFVLIDPKREPRDGDVVAALIDNESTLKTFSRRNGQASLRAENAAYPELIPADQLLVQGVMVGLFRRA